MQTLSGGCHCGRLRYQVDGELVEAGYCHCSICRRTTGATMLAFASFPVSGFRYIAGQPSIYASSERGQREFCGHCGTQICHRALTPVTVDINSGTLDQPGAALPQFHIYMQDALLWPEIADALPRYRQGRCTQNPSG